MLKLNDDKTTGRLTQYNSSNQLINNNINNNMKYNDDISQQDELLKKEQIINDLNQQLQEL